MSDGVRVALRTTGSAESGLGHINRCLALAHALHAHGVETLFLLDGDRRVRDRVAVARFRAAGIRPEHDLADTIRECRPFRPGVMIVDAYAANPAYFSGLADTAGLVAIDDLADRMLPVDLVVNGAVGAQRLAYRGAPYTRYLLGPSYVLLRPEFAEPPPRAFKGDVQRVLITLGGSDPERLAARLVRWTAKALGAVTQDVVVGPYFPGSGALEDEARAALGSVVLHQDPADMRRLMLGADLAICGGGQTTYELAATGTPAIAIQLAENQVVNLKGLAEAGVLVRAGAAADANLESKLADAVNGLAADPRRRQEMGRRGRALVDGGGAARVARAVLKLAGARR